MKAKVILFKRSGKYYTEEEWEVPAEVPRVTGGMRPAILPADMEYSKDFRRIDGGPVLVESQEPWGYPHLFPEDRGVEVARPGDAGRQYLDGVDVTTYGSAADMSLEQARRIAWGQVGMTPPDMD